jgi:nucleoside-diphosphate-sugar epimerase
MHILVTGAGGYIGSPLLTELKKQGYWLRAVSRSTKPSLEIADEHIIQTLNPGTHFEPLLDGIDTIINLADGFNAYEHLPASTHPATIPEATLRLKTVNALANAASKQEVRLIYLSTVKTMCGTYADQILTEHSLNQPTSLYGLLKLKAEQAIFEAAEEHAQNTVILRFPITFGVQPKGNMEKLLRLADTPLPLPFRACDNRRSLISATSLIDAIVHTTKSEHQGKNLFLVQDGALSTYQIISLMRRGLNRPQRMFALPESVFLTSENIPSFGPKIRRLTRSLELDDTRFRQAYDWRPKEQLSNMLIKLAETWKNN